jgi:hypothetical protein
MTAYLDDPQLVNLTEAIEQDYPGEIGHAEVRMLLLRLLFDFVRFQVPGEIFGETLLAILRKLNRQDGVDRLFDALKPYRPALAELIPKLRPVASLTDRNRESLRKAILDAFDRDQLRMTMAEGNPSRNFDDVVKPGKFAYQVFDLLDKADKEGWLSSLLDTLINARSEKKSFVEFVRPFAEKGNLSDDALDETARAPSTQKSGQSQNMACIELLSATLYNGLPEKEDIASLVVKDIAGLTGLAAQRLFDAVSYFIEYQLVKSPAPESFELLLPEKMYPVRANRLLVDRLKELSMISLSDARPIEVDSDFFNRTRDREPLWQSYFEALTYLAHTRPEQVKSVSRIRVTLGFLAPQYLLAGLLARFDDDWRPVLMQYEGAIPQPSVRNGAFESLQASQWNCWLMWGPSVPICRCARWRGLVAFQYGYGDENNSIPVLQVPSDATDATGSFDAIAQSLYAERRGAQFASLVGRLRWGPSFLRAEWDDTSPAQDSNSGEQDKFEDREAPMLRVAPAQTALYRKEISTNLVFQLERIYRLKPEKRVYYSAYFWLMFLVAVPPRRPELATTGPSRLRGKVWPERQDPRRRVRDARLWEDLLPVFVHANIGDPAAFSFQKKVLVENAVQMLRQIWDRRDELFDKDDVKAGIKFHLVCGSDYSGCGSRLRFLIEDPLLGYLRRRRACEPDKAFADALMLPPDDETEETRPWALAQFVSACQLPNLIEDYYSYVKDNS